MTVLRRWCPFGCGKSVYMAFRHRFVFDGPKRRVIYECDRCGALFLGALPNRSPELEDVYRQPKNELKQARAVIPA